MPDDDIQDEEPQETNDADADAAGGGWPRWRYAALAGGAFFLSALIALAAGGHFRRRPLSALRHVPLLGRLVPAPPAPPGKEGEAVPTVAELHPMPAIEISELIQNLHDAQKAYAERRKELDQQEERLRALQTDLQRERDLLDGLMGSLAARQTDVEARRKAFEAEVILAKAEERKRLTKLARIYEAQSPEAAAAELEALDKSAKGSLAAKILSEMQEKKAAPIFDAMKPNAALALKEQISAIRYQVAEEAEKGGATP